MVFVASVASRERSRLRWASLLLLAIISATLIAFGPAHAADQVGAASRVQGQANAINAGKLRKLQTSSPVLSADQLATGEESRLEITFTDGSLLTMGANANLKVNDYVFEDPAKKNALQLLAVGAFKMVSGAINKPNGDNISVITPVGALGVRGTDIWAGPIDGVYGVFLLDGQVTVTTNAGSVTLNKPGSGTNIPDIDSPPGPITQWPQQKVDRALNAVAFR